VQAGKPRGTTITKDDTKITNDPSIDFVTFVPAFVTFVFVSSGRGGAFYGSSCAEVGGAAPGFSWYSIDGAGGFPPGPCR
jgi:hypothetical protein